MIDIFKKNITIFSKKYIPEIIQNVYHYYSIRFGNLPSPYRTG